MLFADRMKVLNTANTEGVRSSAFRQIIGRDQMEALEHIEVDSGPCGRLGKILRDIGRHPPAISGQLTKVNDIRIPGYGLPDQGDLLLWDIIRIDDDMDMVRRFYDSAPSGNVIALLAETSEERLLHLPQALQAFS